MPAPEISVILPTFNERASVPGVVRSIHQALAGWPHEVVVVDDNSPDGTWRWAEEASRSDPGLRVVRRMSDPGLSASVLDGFKAARGSKWIVMDADGQHDAALLARMAQALDQHELVVASRYASGGEIGRWTLVRRAGSLGATWLAQLLLNVPLTDPMSGFFGVRSDAASPVMPGMNPRGFKVLLELYYRLGRRAGKAGVRCAELPYRFGRRTAGASKLNQRIIWQYLQMLLELRLETGWPQGLPKFLLVGAAGAVVNCAALAALAHGLRWHYLLAAPVAIEASILHNFFWNDRWTFKDRRRERPWATRLGQYQLTALAGLAVNWVVLAVLVEGLRWRVLPANIAGIASATGLNFVISKLWTWKRQPSAAIN